MWRHLFSFGLGTRNMREIHRATCVERPPPRAVGFDAGGFLSHKGELLRRDVGHQHSVVEWRGARLFLEFDAYAVKDPADDLSTRTGFRQFAPSSPCPVSHVA
jgi:hypothetical protein